MATVQAGKCVSCAQPFTSARRVCCSAALEARYVLENGDEEHHHTDPVCQECCPCSGANRIDKLEAKRAALEAALRELADALPPCTFRVPAEGGGLAICGKLALYGTASHEPERCEEHRHEGYRRNRECDWAEAARLVAKLLREEG